MVVGLLGNKSTYSNRFILVFPKSENDVRLQATLGSKNHIGLPMGVVSPLEEVNIHHIEEDLEIDKVNKLGNLVTVCKDCHYIKHNKSKPKTKAKQKIGKVKINQNGIISKSPIMPRKEVLIEEIKTTSFVQLGKKYGVSDNAVRKWAKNYGIYDQRMIKLKKNT